MSEFQSKLETLLPAEELFFDATPGFGRYKPFLEQAIAHPAKMNTRLTEYLIKTLTEEGDIILDPMSGSGQTGVVASLLGRDAVCVELEEKFYKWQLQAKAKIEASQTLSVKGKISCLLGDARKLSEILSSVDAVVTSPPYADGVKGPSRSPLWERLAQDPTSNRYGRKQHPTIGEGYGLTEENIGNLPIGEIDAVITSPPYSEGLGHGRGKSTELQETKKLHLHGAGSYAENPDNIGEIRTHRQIDAVITSPPYAIDPKNVCHTKEGKTLEEYDKKRGFKPTAHQRIAYSTNPENIGHLPLENIDAVITSPPYSESMTKKRKGYTIYPELEKSREMPQDTKDDNIANLSHGNVDAVITSPPYEHSMEGGSRHHPESEPHYKIVREKHCWNYYSDDKTGKQIGNLKKETYLEAMLKVYMEMWKVLKEGGLAMVVVKPFIRNKKVVDLPYQTWLLMQKCGFKLTKLFKLRLTQQSFWRILYQKKHPEVEVIAHEYVLVCQK